MQTPLEIDFQGMAGTVATHDAVTKHVAELEQRFGRVTACRVVLKGPAAITRRVDCMRSTSGFRSPTVGKSMWSARQRRTSGTPT